MTGRSGRGLAAAAAAAATMALAAAPAGAAAGGAPYAGKGSEFTISFDVVSEDGKPKRIKDFRFRRVRIDCTTGDSPFSTRSEPPHFGPFRVNRRGRFGRTFTNTGQRFNGTVEIRGEFVRKRRVDGTLEINGDYPSSGRADCTSGKLDWTARLS